MGNWHKSTYSDANGGDCAQAGSVDVVMVLDTSDGGRSMAEVHGIAEVTRRSNAPSSRSIEER